MEHGVTQRREQALIWLADILECSKVIEVYARHRGQREILRETRQQQRIGRQLRRLLILLRWSEAPASLRQVMNAERGGGDQ